MRCPFPWIESCKMYRTFLQTCRSLLLEKFLPFYTRETSHHLLPWSKNLDFWNTVPCSTNRAKMLSMGIHVESPQKCRSNYIGVWLFAKCYYKTHLYCSPTCKQVALELYLEHNLYGSVGLCKQVRIKLCRSITNYESLEDWGPFVMLEIYTIAMLA